MLPRLTQALDACLDAPGLVGLERLAVAASGGLDSCVLAVYAQAAAQARGLALHLFHIHHGLQAWADQWQAQVHALADLLGVTCHSLRVTVDPDSGLGLEAAARAARYGGLAQLADQVDVRHILLAHHRDDQAETVLLRLLRGAGPQGLAAMQTVTEQNGLTLLRPFLHLDRRVLQAAWEHWPGARHVTVAQDPSNADPRYTRAALRALLVPALDARWPAWRGNLARHAALSAETHTLLHAVAAQDFSGLNPAADNSHFSLAAWRALSSARQALVLRYWLGLHGLAAPTQARLRELMRQLRGVHALGHDRHLRLRHAGAWIVCVRGRVGLRRGD